MKMKRILFSLLILTGLTTNAQVKDISVTISPAAEYTWWDAKAGLEDGFMMGGKLGFGFGEFMELRGVYLQSFDLMTNFDHFGLPGYRSGLFKPDEVLLKRWGGEFKANIGTKNLKPYITLGTGVQNIELTGMDKTEQIYASLGLGMKLNMGYRTVLLVEAKNTTYNFNAVSNLLGTDNINAFGVNPSSFSNERLDNWSVQGSLQFYLGGRKPGDMTDLDDAYLRQFKGGLQGVQPILEPGASYLVFDENSLFRDTWMVGGYAGLDITEFIGIRGFYFQSLEEMNINTDFDNLAMYGIELRARLNEGAGITPFISLGGGYLDPNSDYMGKNDAGVSGSKFASGGLGLNIPLGKRILINGGARAMLTSGVDALDISMPEQLQTNMMYNAGIKFTLGKSSKSPESIYRENLDRELSYQAAENKKKMQQMKKEYLQNIFDLEEKLAEAYDANDLIKAKQIIVEKDQVQKSLTEIEKLEKISSAPVVSKNTESEIEIKANPEKSPMDKKAGTNEIQERTTSTVIKMSPAELESLIVNILKAIQETPKKAAIPAVQDSVSSTEVSPLYNEKVDLLNQRIDLLEKLLFEMKIQKVTGENRTPNLVVPETTDNTGLIMEKLEALDRKIESNARKIANDEEKTAAVVVTPVTDVNNQNDAYITAIDNAGEIQSHQKVSEIEVTEVPTFIYRNSGLMLGINFGGATTVNFGARLYYDINNIPLDFVPEIYIGLGNSTSLGISGNVIYPFSLKNEKFVPYAGVGLGISRIDRNLKGNYNVILGTQLPFISKNLSIDYTMRNSFEYNQLAITYLLPF